MNFKAIQKKWYDKIAKKGFEDLEDHELQGVPLKKWTGCSMFNDSGTATIIDIYHHQPAEGPLISSFPEPFINLKESFMNTQEFIKACIYLSTTSKSKLTVKSIVNIWQRHCDGISERVIAKEIGTSSGTAHYTIARMTEWMNTMAHEEPIYEDDPAQSPKAKVILRSYNHDKDAPFIFSSWRNALWYSEDRDENLSNIFYRRANQEIKHLIKDFFTTVKIACLSDDHDQIVGYSVMKKDNLEFVYVKKDYRKQGVAKLLSKGFKTISEPFTIEGRSIAAKHNYILGE